MFQLAAEHVPSHVSQLRYAACTNADPHRHPVKTLKNVITKPETHTIDARVLWTLSIATVHDAFVKKTVVSTIEVADQNQAKVNHERSHQKK